MRNKINATELEQLIKEIRPIRDNKEKKAQQFKITIDDIDIHYPYKPYDNQIRYMTTVIQALQNKQNALLQSPTGTGKTLSLLCSCLAWLQQKRLKQKKRKEEIPCKILYCIRTHSQIRTCIQELRKTVYQPITCQLGSRDQLCIKLEFQNLKGLLLNSSCKRAQFENSCPYYTQAENSQFTNISNFVEIEGNPPDGPRSPRTRALAGTRTRLQAHAGTCARLLAHAGTGTLTHTSACACLHSHFCPRPPPRAVICGRLDFFQT